MPDYTAAFRNALAGYDQVSNRGVELAQARQQEQQRMEALKMQEEYKRALMAQAQFEQEQLRAKAEQEAQSRNALAQVARGRDVSWDEVMAGPMPQGQQPPVIGNVPYSYEESVRMLAPAIGEKEYLSAIKPEDPYKSLPGDLRARMMADQDPRIAAALQAEDERKLTQARAGASSVSVNTGEKGFKHERELRNDWRGEPIVKDYGTIKEQTSRLDAAMDEYRKNQKSGGGSNVAIDQALITIYNKMLDPTSVVRESEYARTQSDLSVVNRFKGLLEKGWSGGAGLTPQDREALATMARRFSGIAKERYNDTRKEYARTASKWGFDPSYVVGEEPSVVPAPPAAIDHLMKNPQLKAAFKAKYGYLPEGM